MTNKDLGRRLFDAIERGDADAMRSVCAADFVGTQNGGPAMDLRGLIAFAQGSVSVVKDFRYENVVAQDTMDGFVEEHDVVGTLPDGEQCACAFASSPPFSWIESRICASTRTAIRHVGSSRRSRPPVRPERRDRRRPLIPVT